jgi:hypothetical protein
LVDSFSAYPPLSLATLKPKGLLPASFIIEFGQLRTVAKRDPRQLGIKRTFSIGSNCHLKDLSRVKVCFVHHAHPDEIHELFAVLSGGAGFQHVVR